MEFTSNSRLSNPALVHSFVGMSTGESRLLVDQRERGQHGGVDAMCQLPGRRFNPDLLWLLMSFDVTRHV